MGASISKEPSIHQLRLYLTLSEELHFGRAAARLFITQPALSALWQRESLFGEQGLRRVRGMIAAG
ncbi:LysR family transcriptional regulator [Streptomyces scabiei]|uniref:LysR family transcriptional regulator n=2 Tax=Streptomyces scabiei TaxID=1930 RepID=UPI000765AC7C